MSQNLRYPNEVTIESQTKKVQDRITRYQIELDLVNKALPVLKSLEGKKITKHITNAVQKAIPEYDVSLNTQYGMYHIAIYTRDPGRYEKIVDMLIGYHGSIDTVQYDAIVKHNQCYLLNAERLPKLKAGLEHIPALVRQRDEILAIHRAMTAEAEKYEMDYDFDFEK